MTRLYQGSRRNRILNGVLLKNAEEVGSAVLAAPYIDNFESDTIGDNEATMEAKDYHWSSGGVGSTGVTCQADDYDAMPAINNGVSFTNVITNIGSSACYNQMMLPAGQGYGYIPTDNGVPLLEAIVYASGTGAQIDCYMQGGAGGNDGVFMFFNGSQFNVQTRLGGVLTPKVIIPSTLSSSPFAQCWFYLGWQYNFATNITHCRVIELGTTGATQEDTGWKSGTVNSPTFPSGTEWVKTTVTAKSSTTAYCGVAQTRFCDQLVDGYGLANNLTRTYIDEVT
jgi:hypothetical protein